MKFPDKKGFSILIPVYNEGTHLPKIVAQIKSRGYKNIIIVDDGSNVGSAALNSIKDVLLLRHAINLGQGAALSTGITAAKSHELKGLITMDGDGQHDPAEIDNFAQKINDGWDVVLGRRNFKSKDVPFFNRYANYAASFLAKILYRINISDTQCGFRGYSKKALETIKVDSPGYEFQNMVLGEISKNNLKFVDIPVKTIYTKHSRTKEKRQNLYNGIVTLYKIIFSL